MRTLVVIFGVVCGAYVGLGFGILGAMGLGLFSQWADPNDPSAASVAIVVIVTGPGGAMLGAALGGLFVAKRPRLFLATVLPLGVLFLGLHLTLSALRYHDVSRTYVLKVTGKQGEEFIGEVRVDGQLHKVKGNLPADFEFRALMVEFAFALPSAKQGEKIAIEVIIDGKPWRGGKQESEKRFAAKYQSFGYSETFGRISSWDRSDLLPEHIPASQK